MEMDQLFLDLLAPTARLLGEWWASDRCDFATVTLGTMQLRRMQHDLAPMLVAGRRGPAAAPKRIGC